MEKSLLQRSLQRLVDTVTNLEEEYQHALMHVVLSYNSLEAQESKDLSRVTGEQGIQHTITMV